MKTKLSLVEVVDMVKEGFDGVDADYNHDKRRVLVTLFGAENDSQMMIYIVGENEMRERQGVHMLAADDVDDDLERRLWDAIDSGARDGFDSIYIHEREVAS